MSSWLLPTLICTCCWGFWGFFGKLASRTLEAQNLMLLSAFGALCLFPFTALIFYKYFTFETNQMNYYYAILGGFVGSLGGLFFFLSINKGEASKVVCITALYPVITVILTYFILKEPLSASKLAGIVLAICSVYLLSK